MSTELITSSGDLSRLRNEGYDIEVKDACLLVRDIPYLNNKCEIRTGVLISDLDLSGDRTAKPRKHTIFFTGGYPHRQDGSKITGIQCNEFPDKTLAGYKIRYEFSAYKTVGNGQRVAYDDYYDKVCSYIRRLTHPASAVFPGITAKTGVVREMSDPDHPFLYMDTASAKAGITDFQDRLKTQTIGIIGLGGTGSYILDFVAKTWVKEIHLFDQDIYLQQNAFRSPGAASLEQLRAKQKKVDYYGQIYGAIRRKIVRHPFYINDENLSLLECMDFVFICVDRSANREPIISYLKKNKIPFIDTGMGIQSTREGIRGSIRNTTSTLELNSHIHDHQLIPLTPGNDDNDYAQNIQIVELNALNAALAVIRWKKMLGFYLDQAHEHHSVYRIGLNRIVNEELVDSNK